MRRFHIHIYPQRVTTNNIVALVLQDLEVASGSLALFPTIIRYHTHPRRDPRPRLS